MKTSAIRGLLIVLFAVSSLLAQEIPNMPKPQKEHEWLQQFVGAWETDMEASMGPGQPPMKCKGVITSRTIGGFWVVSEMKSEMMGMPMTAIQTIGYDPQLKKYVGTWIDSMMSHMWKYEGTVDKSDKILTLEAEGPNFMQPGKFAKFRDVYEFKTKDQIVISSFMQGDDGKWVIFMNGTSRRKK